MSRTLLNFVFAGAALVVMAACSPAPTSVSPAPAPASGSDCPILPATTITQVTGTSVRGVARGSFVGAGGTCGNYTTAAGEPYLGINRLSSRADYSRSLAAVPDSIYPVRTSLPGVGEEAILFTDSAARSGG
jgi:hypothetical protein